MSNKYRFFFVIESFKKANPYLDELTSSYFIPSRVKWQKPSVVKAVVSPSLSPEKLNSAQNHA